MSRGRIAHTSVLAVAAALLASASGAGADPLHLSWQDGPRLRGGRIGLKVQPMTPELREFMKAPRDRGVLVSEVAPERPAAAAGLRVGDVITGAAGEPVARPMDLVRAVARVSEGEKLALDGVRAGETIRLEVSPEGRPAPWADPENLGIWIQQNIRRGGRELQKQLDEIERRLEELERRLDEAPTEGDWGAQRT